MTKPTMRLLGRVCLVALLSTAALAAEQLVEFRNGFTAEFGISSVDPAKGPQTFSFKATKGIPPRAAYLDARALGQIGGIFFLGVAKSSGQTSNSCPSLRIDLSRPTGKRLAVRFSETSEVYGEIFDWELIPTAEYVQSGDAGLFTYMGDRAEYHKAFSDNLVGLNFFLLDNSRNWAKFPYAHLFLAGPVIEGYPQTQPTESNTAAWDLLRAFLGDEQLMFFDRDVEFIFSAEDKRLSISGAPYWAAVAKNDTNDNGHVVRAFRNVTIARLTNPTIYDSAYRVSQYSAFFRHIVQNCPSSVWTKFSADLQEKRKAMTEVRVPPGKMWDKTR